MGASPRPRRGSRPVTSVLRRGADWAGVVEAAQQEARDDETWARSVASAAKGLFAIAHEPSLAVLEHSPSCDSAEHLALVMANPDLELARDGAITLLGVSGFRAFYYPPTIATTYLEIERTVAPDTAARAAEFRRRNDVGDALGLFAYPEPGVVVSLFVVHDRENPAEPQRALSPCSRRGASRDELSPSSPPGGAQSGARRRWSSARAQRRRAPCPRP